MEIPEITAGERFAAAVAAEVRAELARREGMSVRDFAALLGVNHNAVNDRLNVNARTGKRVTINVRDLAEWSAALDLPPETFILRADASLAAGSGAQVIDIRDRKTSPRPPSVEHLRGLPATGEPKDRIDPGDDEE